MRITSSLISLALVILGATVAGIHPVKQVRATSSSESMVELKQRFTIFNTMLYADMPRIGKRLPVVYEQKILLEDDDPTAVRPSRKGLTTAVSDVAEQVDGAWKADGPFAVLDIERWPLWPMASEAEHLNSVIRYRNSARDFRAALGRPICLFSIAPIGGVVHTNMALSDVKIRSAWNAANDVLAFHVVPEVDALCPEVYTFYGVADPAASPEQHQRAIEQWQVFARQTIGQARRISKGKPVFAFIWPQYHNGGNFNDFRFVPADYWRVQLETLRLIADGIVLWGGWDQKAGIQLPWDESAPWWQVTRDVFKLN